MEEKSIAEVNSEIKLIRWLREQGCNAMEPIAMKCGKYADVVNTKWGQYNVSCFARVPGKDLEDCEGSLELVRGYGSCLGTLHKLVKDYPAKEERRDHQEMLTQIKSRLLSFEAPQYVLTEFDQVSKELSKFLAGYREENSFTREEEDTLPLMRRLVRLQEYSVLQYVMSEPVLAQEEWLTELTRKLSKKQRYIEEEIQKG